MSKRLNQILFPILIAVALGLMGSTAEARPAWRGWHAPAPASDSRPSKPTVQPAAGEPDVGQTSTPPPKFGLVKRPGGDGGLLLEWWRTWIGINWKIRLPR